MQRPIDIADKAIGEHIKSFALRIGKDKSLIYKWLSESEADPYTRFIAYLEAAQDVNPDGAELLFRDLESRYTAKRDGELIKGAKWEEVLADAMTLTHEALSEALKRGPELESRVARAIIALRWLLTQQRADSD